MVTQQITTGWENGVRIGQALPIGADVAITLAVFLAAAVWGLWMLRAIFRWIKR
jgi:hypothetical protein